MVLLLMAEFRSPLKPCTARHVSKQNLAMMFSVFPTTGVHGVKAVRHETIFLSVSVSERHLNAWSELFQSQPMNSNTVIHTNVHRPDLEQRFWPSIFSSPCCQAAPKRLHAVGLHSIPTHLKPVHVVSEGEKERFLLAMALQKGSLVQEGSVRFAWHLRPGCF